MKIFPIAFACLLWTLSVVGQEGRTVTVEEFSEMVYRGTRAVVRPYRYTMKDGGQALRFEEDAKGSTHTVSFNPKTGATYSECIIIGDQIYERTESGAWTVQSREKYKAIASHNEATWAAMNRATPHVIVEPTNANVTNKTISFVGRETRFGTVLRLYRFQGSTNKFTPPSADIRELRIEIVYGFDENNGALLLARSRNDWVYESKTNTFTGLYEWEPDPSIVITAPAVAGSDRKL